MTNNKTALEMKDFIVKSKSRHNYKRCEKK